MQTMKVGRAWSAVLPRCSQGLTSHQRKNAQENMAIGRRGDSFGISRRLVSTLAAHMAAPMNSHAAGTASAAAPAP